MSIAEFSNKQYDAALQDAQRVHRVPHDGYAASHYIAGQVLEQKNQLQDATVEYQLYLKEAPNGAEAAAVRDAMTRIDDRLANVE